MRGSKDAAGNAYQAGMVEEKTAWIDWRFNKRGPIKARWAKTKLATRTRAKWANAGAGEKKEVAIEWMQKACTVQREGAKRSARKAGDKGRGGKASKMARQ